MSNKNQPTYTGSVYIGVVGSENETGACRDSIENIITRPGDTRPFFVRGTKGYESRQSHINNFLESQHDFILFLDSDMFFLPDLLERLRSHKLPYVSGLYMRRQYQPQIPIWFRPYTGRFPYEPWAGPIERGKLHKIGASGWGCVLVHRAVVLAVREQLCGEQEILEDDMDVYPYSLPDIMRAVKGLRNLVSEHPSDSTLYPALDTYTAVLEREIRPLRADRDNIGSDIRFPFFALQAGYQLYGDPDARCGHDLHYPISPDDWDGLPPAAIEATQKNMVESVRNERRRLAEQKAALL